MIDDKATFNGEWRTSTTQRDDGNDETTIYIGDAETSICLPEPERDILDYIVKCVNSHAKDE